eukprot:208204-Rhodomonas_salina.1
MMNHITARDHWHDDVQLQTLPRTRNLMMALWLRRRSHFPSQHQGCGLRHPYTVTLQALKFLQTGPLGIMMSQVKVSDSDKYPVFRVLGINTGYLRLDSGNATECACSCASSQRATGTVQPEAVIGVIVGSTSRRSSCAGYSKKCRYPGTVTVVRLECHHDVGCMVQQMRDASPADMSLVCQLRMRVHPYS